MTRQTYALLERYMLSCMEDSAHDAEHIYRVLYHALQIAKTQENVDYDVLIAACLLHDVGRKEQFADPGLCHAEVGSQKAWSFLVNNGFSEDFAGKVRHCVLTHRFRKDRHPQTLEAKILFDADKLDVTGALGIARTLLYQGDRKQPLYTRRSDGTVCDGTQNPQNSFFREYQVKLAKLYDRFYTDEGSRIAGERKQIAEAFYGSLYREITMSEAAGGKLLQEKLEECALP